jgi:asparagine synthase (glutamine-hydrolysing)
MLSGAFHTTEESRYERQPVISPSGVCLTWDGRLDNRSELMKRISRSASLATSDLDIASSLYENKGKEIFDSLIGDWSISAFHEDKRALVLAVDFLGTRPLYYFQCDRYVAWSTVLEPLVALADRTFTLCEEYVAGWLYGFPPASLTPYREIRAVPPGSFVEVTPSATSIRQYWNFNPTERQVLNDAAYEEGFRYFFTQAVRRRLRSSTPVVAELSGGMDSSSIVCIADHILEEIPTLAPRLDTLSYLDDTEPDWNERPFVTEVERRRGKSGLHIDVSTPICFLPKRDPDKFSSFPAMGLIPSVPEQQVSERLRSENIRVVLSGLGGDECTGGVPDGTPELADLLVQGKLAVFLRRGVAWSLAPRRPLMHLAAQVIDGFLPHKLFGPNPLLLKVPWLNEDFARRNRANPACSSLRLKLNGKLPSFQENLHTLGDLQRQIACTPLASAPARERRFPFLDRDLLEFLYNIPREQLVQPGRRRFLMRRALRGIVPASLLERKRKAYVARTPLESLQAQSKELTEWTKEMICCEIGAIELDHFQRALSQAFQGDAPHLWRFSRTLELESWLRDARVQSVLSPNILRIAARRTRLSRGIEPRSGNESPQLGKSNQKGGEKHEIREAGNRLRG